MVAAATVTGCDDDTTSTNPNKDMSVAHDLATPVSHDLAEEHD